MNKFIETDYKNKLKNFITQLEISFDYVKEDVAMNVNRYISETDLNDICTEISRELSPYRDVIHKICNTNKVKTKEYMFLENIKLFGEVLKFDLFKDENKNTKKSIVENLNSILNETNVINLLMSKQNVSDADIENLIENMQNMQSTQSTQIPHATHATHAVDLPDMSGLMSGDMSGLMSGDLSGVVNDLMKDETISGLVKDISKEFETGKLNPMDLMSIITNPQSIQQNSALQGIISNITSKVESSVKNGSIDPSKLEEQAKNLLSKIGM